MWKGLLEGGELGTRGWCLQERHLSPRTIHFMKSGLMMWECCCHIGALGEPRMFGPPHAESKPEHYRTRMIDARPTKEGDSDNDLQRVQDGYDGTAKDQTLQNWYHVLADYSTHILTFETDRPIAIQGLVDHVHSVTGFHYYHGIWKEDPIRGLLWERRNHEPDSCS